MSLNKSQRTRSCLIRWVSATTLLTAVILSSVFANKAEANHCGFLDFTGNCIHESSGSEIGGPYYSNPLKSAHPPQNPNSSSSHLTCRNISINSNILSAECDRGGGSYVPTSIGLRGIWNRNGTLQEDPNTNSSSFQLSCRDLSIQGNVLSASCDNGNGAVIRSQLRLGRIWNDHGTLRY